MNNTELLEYYQDYNATLREKNFVKARELNCKIYEEEFKRCSGIAESCKNEHHKGDRERLALDFSILNTLTREWVMIMDNTQLNQPEGEENE